MSKSLAGCRNCGRRSKTSNAHGWYRLSVGVPPEVNDRGYIWLGTWCSLACLTASMPELDRTNRLTADLYERE